METDGGWISISEASRLYQKDRKWVSNQISAYDLETRKVGNQKQLRLTDLIQHRGEPDGNGTARTGTPTEKSQKVAPTPTHETELLRQENEFLRRRIDELEADQVERKEREAWLRQTLALPAPERRGWVVRLVDWARN